MASFSRSPQPRFDMPEITGGPASNVGSAAGTVNLGNAYSTLRKNGPRYDDLSATAIANRAQERATVMATEANVSAAGIQALADVKSQKIVSEAQKEAAQAQARGSMMGSAFGAIGSIGGALLGLSDETTKENIEPIQDALEKLRNLKPVTFNYKDDWSLTSERLHHGFIAQEYKEVLPDATYYDEEYGKYCIDTGDLISLLVRAIQQLEGRVALMEAKNALAGVK